MSTQWLDIEDSRKYLESLTGTKPDSATLHQRKTNKKLTTKQGEAGEPHFGNDKRLLFYTPDLKEMAVQFEKDKGDLLSFKDAAVLFREKTGVRITEGQLAFLLEQEHVSHDARLWRSNFYRPETILKVIDGFDDAKKHLVFDEAKLLTSGDIVKRLKEQYPDRKIDYQTVAYLVRTHQITPFKEVKKGIHTEWRFREESIEDLNLHLGQYYKHGKNGDKPEVVKLDTSQDVKKLEAQYGTLIDLAEATRILSKKASRKYDRVSASALLYRHGKYPVGQFGSSRLWPERDVQSVPVSPATGNRAKVASNG